MSKYRNALPQLEGSLFLADGGMGTTLIFHEELELPHFCAFHLIDDPSGREILQRYFRGYAEVAREQKTGFILDSGPTWRASADWGDRLGYSAEDLDGINRRAIEFMQEIRREYETDSTPIVISGCMGPRGDGYEPGDIMSPDAARQYHTVQIDSFRDAGADMITAMTMTNAEEAVGMTRAAEAAEVPAVMSFTVETDGRLPTGQTLSDAINYVDDATNGAPAYYMINCAHPTHFADVLDAGSNWTKRIRGIRLNASCLSHAELNDSTELDEGDIDQLASEVSGIRRSFPHINVIGGCCGTDSRHIRRMATLI